MLLFSCFTLIASLCKMGKQLLYKYCFMLSSVFFSVLTIKNARKEKYETTCLLCSKKNALSMHIYFYLLFIQITITKNYWNKKHEILNNPKDIKNEKKLGIYKKEKTNLAASMKSIGKILWWTQLGRGRLPAPIRPKLTPYGPMS